MVIGIRSPPSRTRSMTNCPGFAEAAMSGASMRKYFVTGVSRRVSRIRGIYSLLEIRMLVHGLEPPPATVRLVLNALHRRGVLRREEVTRLPHELQPVRHGMPAAHCIRIVGEVRVAMFDLIEREETAVDRSLQHLSLIHI